MSVCVSSSSVRWIYLEKEALLPNSDKNKRLHLNAAFVYFAFPRLKHFFYFFVYLIVPLILLTPVPLSFHR